MTDKAWIIPALLLVAAAGGAAGFGTSHFRDNRAIGQLTAERDQARDCRQTGATIAPCPVVYRNTKIEWRDKIETVRAPDPHQAARITALSGELARAERRIRNLSRRQKWPRASLAYAWQNGTMQRPYYTDERCPNGSVIEYDTGLSTPGRHSGDPNVCYVVTKLHRLALSTPRR